MAFKTLLVAVDLEPDSGARVGLACDLAAGWDAHLIGVCGVTLAPPPLSDPLSGGAMVGEAFTLFRDSAEADLRAALTQFHARVAMRGDRSEWRGRLGWPVDAIVREARGADLVILGRRPSRSPNHGVDPADVLMAIGRPVLVVPPRPARGPTGWPAVIAWKDTREAQRATAAALPLLRHAARVHLLEVSRPEDHQAAASRLADVAVWLGRHGIEADTHVGSHGPISVAQDILDFADRYRAGLIVAGGYGHARLRQWALGGVTRKLLADAPVCILLCH